MKRGGLTGTRSRNQFSAEVATDWTRCAEKRGSLDLLSLAMEWLLGWYLSFCSGRSHRYRFLLWFEGVAWPGFVCRVRRMSPAGQLLRGCSDLGYKHPFRYFSK